MRHPKKLSPEDELPLEVKELVKSIAKLFRKGGLNYFLVKKYLHNQIVKEALDVSGGSIYKAAKVLGIKYSTMYLNVKRQQKRIQEELCGKN